MGYYQGKILLEFANYEIKGKNYQEAGKFWKEILQELEVLKSNPYYYWLLAHQSITSLELANKYTKSDKDASFNKNFKEVKKFWKF